MSKTLYEVFEEHFSHVKFNSKLAKAFYQFQVSFVNRNTEHLNFFGGNLLGVNVIRFKDSDVNEIFNDILDVDMIELNEDIKNVPAINKDWKISSDILNITLMYCIHKFLTSSGISEKERKRGAYDVALIFFYRCICALCSHGFRYPADPDIVQAAYANLSNKYLIKKLGSWHKVMDYRAHALIAKDSIHYTNLIKFNDDFATIYAINDSQGRIKDLFKNYYSEIVKVHTVGDSISTISGTYIDAEGSEVIKEKTKSVERYVLYGRNIIIDKHSFIKDDLIKVINDINSNTSFKMIKQTLNWFSDEYNHKKYHDKIDDFVSSVIIYSMYLLNNDNLGFNSKDYSSILINLKNLYLSTRSVDPDLLKIKDIGYELIKLSNKNKMSESLLLSTRTSIILYITLRVITGIK